MSSTSFKGPLHISLETGVQGYGMTFKVCNLDSKQPYFNSAYVVRVPTLEFLINVQHVYLIFIDFSFLHALIRNYTFINFDDLFLPTLLIETKIKPEHGKKA